GSVPEMVEGGRTGFVVSPQDSGGMAAATARILRVPGLRTSMSRLARERAISRFDTQVCVELHARAFRAAAANTEDRRRGIAVVAARSGTTIPPE
ncbi:MAG TPA: hypothetical protein VIX12_03335, partial [Candidatus Binataceae bacterium]